MALLFFICSRYFIAFLVGNVALSSLTAGTSASVIVLKVINSGDTVVTAIETSIPETVVFCYSVLMFVSLFSLW